MPRRIVPPRSPAPSTKAFCSSMVAITGCVVPGSNSLERRVGDAGDVAGELDHHALQPEADPEGGHAALAGPLQGAELALDPPDAEATGHEHRVDPAEGLLRAGLGLALVAGDPADAHLGVVVEAAGAHRLGDREVGVGQVDVLADQGDLDVVLGVVHPAQQLVPVGPVDVAERQAEPADDVGVQALGVQDLGDVVDARGVDAAGDRLGVDVAHQRDLALDALGDLAVGAQHDGVGLDADLAQRGHRVLGRLGLQLTAGREVGHQRDVQEEDVVAAHVVAHLACGLEERQRLDVADGAADLGDDDVRPGAAGGQVRLGAHPGLDLVGDVRDHLDRVAEVLPAPLLGDDLVVDLAGRHVGRPAQGDVQEALVVTDVQVGLGPVLGDEDLTVLERVHRPRVDVEIGVELLHRHAQAAGPQEMSEAGCREALAERRGDAPGHEDVFCLLHHGL